MTNSRFPFLRFGLLAVIALCALALGACGDDDGSSSSEPAAAGELIGTQWTLDTASLGVAEGESVNSFIRFDRKRVSGSDGCNQLTGDYEADGSKLTFGALAGTQMACIGPADEVARRVNAALVLVEGYAIDGDTLSLSGDGGDPLLSYSASTPGVEGSWEATSLLYDDAIRSVLTGTKLTAKFETDGKVSGYAGCNSFSGGYTYESGKLEIGPFASTKRACVAPEGAAEQEQGYLAALESAVKIIDQVGDRLTLLNAKGQMAVVFKRR